MARQRDPQNFREKIVNNTFPFGLIDVLLENMLYQCSTITFSAIVFIVEGGSKLEGKCDIHSSFFIDDNDISKKIDCEFIITKSSLTHLPIYNMTDQVNTKSVF